MRTKYYYIQNTGYIGNALKWWAKKSQGYTSDITQAEMYTEEEANRIIERPEDIAWPCEYIDNNLKARKTIIDCQYLDFDKRVTGNLV